MKFCLSIFSAMMLCLVLAVSPAAASSEYFGTGRDRQEAAPQPQPRVKPSAPSAPARESSGLTPTQVFKQCAPAVVTIAVVAKGKFVGHGSGFFVSPKGFILTNSHVVSLAGKGGVAFIAITHGGKKLPLQLVKSDPQIDLALLKAAGTGHQTLRPGKASLLQVGDPVYIIGTPVRLEFRSSMTNGLVSGVDRHKGRLQTNAVIHGGNSGGPVLNAKGEVVAVAVAVATKVQRKKMMISKNKVANVATLEAADGISFMIPIEYARNLLNMAY